jgi:hypothetical protein
MTDHSTSPRPEQGPNHSASLDLREQLVNDGTTGTITEVSLPEANITRLRGILSDVDPKLLRAPANNNINSNDPITVYQNVIMPMLVRHKVLAKAEVRMSGSGLHLILRFGEPIEFQTENERKFWASLVKVVQRLLPTDPDVSGITAMTRPVGSINSKNGKMVTLITPGAPVTKDEMLELFRTVKAAPVKTVASILLGSEKVTPCPICKKEGTSLAAMDRFAKCYGSCGSVKLSQIYDVFLAPPPKAKGC